MTWMQACCALCGGRDASLIFGFPDSTAPGGTAKIVRCLRCGLRRLDPRPDSSSIKEHYGEGYYTLQGRTRGRLKQAVWDRLRDASAHEPPGGVGPEFVAMVGGPVGRRVFDINVGIGEPPPRVLDVGCGFGDLLLYLQQRGCDVLGVESDPGAAAVGSELGVPIRTEPLGELDLAPASFDVVVMSHSLEHLDDPLTALTEVARVLRPGGTLHLAVPNGAAPGLEQQKEEWGALCYPVHFWYFDPHTLSSLLARAGFAVVWTSSADIFGHHIAFWRRRVRQSPSSSLPALARAISHRVRTPLTGDVLRVIARLRAEVAPEPSRLPG